MRLPRLKGINAPTMPTSSPAIASRWVDFFFLLGGLAIPYAIIAYWLRLDGQLAFWDRRSYLTLARAVSQAFHDSTIDGLKMLWRLTPEDYNGYFVSLLLPFLHGRDTSLHAYIAALLLVSVPLCLLAALQLGRIVLGPNKHATWRHVWPLLAITPIGWVVSLGGLPDSIPASALIAGAILLAINLRTIHLVRLIVAATLIALSVVFRRHFVYPTLTIVAAFAAIRWLHAIRNGHPWLRAILNAVWPSLVVGLVTLATVTLLVPDFVSRALSHNYEVAYAGYINPPFQVLVYAMAQGGWILLALGAAGWGLLLRDSSSKKLELAFIALWLGLWLGIWALKVRFVNAHYFFCIWIIFLTVAYWGLTNTLATRCKRGVSWALPILYGLLLACSLQALLPNQFLGGRLAHSHALASLIPDAYPPTVNANLDNYTDLLRCIANAAPESDQTVLVAASSPLLNRDTMASLREQTGTWAQRVHFPPMPVVDSRDGPPFSALLRADVVVTATPFQHHLAPKAQRTVAAVNEAFTEHRALSGHYTKLCTISLSDTATMTAYKRRGPVNGALVQAIAETSQATGMVTPPWALLQDGYEWATTATSGDHTVLTGNAGVSIKPTIFLMTRQLSIGEHVHIDGTFVSTNPICLRQQLTPHILTLDGVTTQVFPTKIFDTSSGSDFGIDLTAPANGYLSLSIDSGSPQLASIGGCGFHINLKVPD